MAPPVMAEMGLMDQTKDSFDFQWQHLPGGHHLLSDTNFRKNSAGLVCQYTRLPAKWFIGKSVVDIGCGSGRFSWALSSLGATVLSVDCSGAGLQATKRGCKHFPDHKILLANIIHPLHVDKQFDLVWCFGVLHHTGNTYQALRNMVALVKDGGYLFVMLYGTPRRGRVADYKEVNKYERERRKLKNLSFEDKVQELKKTVHKDSLHGNFDAFSPTINDLYSKEEIEGWLVRLGFTDIKYTIDKRNHHIVAKKMPVEIKVIDQPRARITDTSNFYPRPRIYRCDDKESVWFHEVVPKEVTLYKELSDSIYMQVAKGNNQTVFKEVNLVPYGESRSPAVIAFEAEEIEKETVDHAQFCEIMFDALTKVVEDTWIPEKFHVVHHSSGYDGRMLSQAIKRLYKKNGVDWLGKLVFLEAGGEAAGFREIMAIQGWGPSRTAVYNDGVEALEYHAKSFEFIDAWRHCNGVVGFPVNVWWEPIEWLQEVGRVPTDNELQCYTGYGSNETTKAIHFQKKGVSWYFNWHYYHNLSNFALKGDWVHPFYNLDFLRQETRYSRGHLDVIGPASLGISKIVLEQLFPKLTNVKKLVTGHLRDKGYFTTSSRILRRAVRDYKNSWYGKHFPNVEPTETIHYNHWWGSWALASFCEYLRSEGHEIKIEQ